MEDRLREILSSYAGQDSELIPILQTVQTEFGYLPEEAMQQVSQFVRLPESWVYGVATFYTQFRLTPIGKKIVKICRGTACHVRGGARILREVEDQLGIMAGETSPDLEYSLETVACFGSCALAPVIVVGEDVYGRVTTTKVKGILD